MPEGKDYFLWQDAKKNYFLLTEFCQIFEYDKKELCVYAWEKSIPQMLGVNTKDVVYETMLATFYIPHKKLTDILNLSKMKKRFNKGSKFIRERESMLGHRIINPFR